MDNVEEAPSRIFGTRDRFQKGQFKLYDSLEGSVKNSKSRLTGVEVFEFSQPKSLGLYVSQTETKTTIKAVTADEQNELIKKQSMDDFADEDDEG